MEGVFLTGVMSSLDARNLDTVSDIILDSNWDVYRQQCRDDDGGYHSA